MNDYTIARAEKRKAYPIGTKLLHTESGIQGVVISGGIFLSDIFVCWENGLKTTYDVEVLEETTKII